VINFGVVYGQSPFGLAKVLSISQEEATEYITKYFASYPGVDDFFRQLLVDCRRAGYVKTILGRRRAIQGVRDPLEMSRLSDPTRQRILPERTAINTVIQGSAADLIKLAMIGVHHRLRREKWRSRLLLQIHDELILESPPDELASLEEMVREEMAKVMELSVPLKVDVKVGKNWSECE
jgi:DNA polymerase-1